MALAWPLILSNLTMSLINATDVLLLGWLGPRELAAAALGLNLTWAFALVAMGMITASAPMMASALGARHNSVRDVRRTFRQSMWLAIAIALPMWAGMLWNAEPIILMLGQQPELAARAGIYLRAICGRPCPSWPSRRCAISSRHWSGLAGSLAISTARHRPQRDHQLGADLRPAGPAGARDFWRRRWAVRSSGSCWASDSRRSSSPTASSAVSTCSAASGAPTGRGFGKLVMLGLPIGLTMGFRRRRVRSRRLSDGPDRRRPCRRACHCAADRGVDVHGPAGPRPGGDGAGRPGAGAGDRAGIARAGWTALSLGVGFMTLMALGHVAVPARSSSACSSTTSGKAAGDALAVRSC